MRFPESALVDQKLVHKRQTENVFIAYLRRGLAPWLPADFWGERLVPALSPEDLGFLQELYQPWHPGGPGLPPERFPFLELTWTSAWLLVDLPRRLEAHWFRGPEWASMSQEDQRFVEAAYPLRTGQESRFRADLPWGDLLRLFELFGEWNLTLSEQDKARASALLEPFEELPHPPEFYGTLSVAPDHPFFFEHRNEHVPGLLVLEAARQLVVAVTHRYGQLPLKGYQFILNRLDSEFLDYLNLNYPIIFKALLVTHEAVRSGRWTQAEFTVEAWQQGETAAKLRLSGRMIDNRVFDRMRQARNRIDPVHRFHPLDSHYHRASLIEEGDRLIEGQLLELSAGGFRFQCSGVGPARGARLGFLFCFEDVGFVRGQADLVWKGLDPETGQELLGLRFHGLPEAEQRRLAQAIRQHCFMRTERSSL